MEEGWKKKTCGEEEEEEKTTRVFEKTLK